MSIAFSPLPSISRCFFIPYSSPAIGFRSCFFFYDRRICSHSVCKNCPSYLLPAWINPSEGRGKPLVSFLSTSFDQQYTLPLIEETSCLAEWCLLIASSVVLNCGVRWPLMWEFFSWSFRPLFSEFRNFIIPPSPLHITYTIILPLLSYLSLLGCSTKTESSSLQELILWLVRPFATLLPR